MQSLCGVCHQLHNAHIPCGQTSLSMADVQALEAAIASGVLKVKYRDQEVTYASFDELQQRYLFVKQAVCGDARPRSSRRTARYSNGLNDCGGCQTRYYD